VTSDEAAFQKGITTAVRTCMGVNPADRAVVITDEATAAIGTALAAEARAAGATTTLLRLEEYGARPFTAVPPEIEAAVRAVDPTVSFYAAQARPGEIAFRIPLMGLLVRQLKVRHGHLIGIDERLIREGLGGADYGAIAALTARVAEWVRPARRIIVTSPGGTDLTAEFSPDLRWQPCPGLYHEPGQWGNLPEGEIFTSPARVDGVLAGEVLGDFFSERYGVLAAPVRLHFTADDPAVRAIGDELLAYLRAAENGDRAGEFAIGTNIGLSALTGNLLQDEKIPGIHIACGNPYPDETGATWRSPVHVDIVSPRATITVDGRELMRDGRFVPAVLNG
jgi:aminopeptidase